MDHCWSAYTLLALFIVTSGGMVACSDPPPPPQPPDAAKEKRANEPRLSPWAPDVALALIPDISGYYRDCNCSGINVGGLERIPYATNDAPELHYLFYGNTLFPHSGNGAGANLGQASLERIVSATANLWDQLGNVGWLPSEHDLSVLTQHNVSVRPLSRFVVAQMALDDTSVAIRADDDASTFTIRIEDSLYMAVPPQRSSNGKEIGVVGIWKRTDIDTLQSAAYSRTLGILAMQRPAVGTITMDILSKELAKAPLVVASWRAFLPASFPQSPAISMLLDQYELHIAHGDSGVEIDSTAQREQLHKAVRACELCHAKAVGAWLDSQHSRSWLTLRSKGQQANPTCLPCHVGSRFDPKIPSRHPEHSAVTCDTCHKTGHKPSALTCEGCHTTQTDPEKHYATRLRTICAGDTSTTRGDDPCPRR